MQPIMIDEDIIILDEKVLVKTIQHFVGSLKWRELLIGSRYVGWKTKKIAEMPNNL